MRPHLGGSVGFGVGLSVNQARYFSKVCGNTPVDAAVGTPVGTVVGVLVSTYTELCLAPNKSATVIKLKGLELEVSVGASEATA